MTMARAKRASPPTVTTSVKLPARMKAAIARFASDEGMTPHGYLLFLIKQGLERSTKRREFIAEGRAALAEFDRTGMAYPAEHVHRYLNDKAAGKNPPRPRPVQWRK